MSCWICSLWLWFTSLSSRLARISELLRRTLWLKYFSLWSALISFSVQFLSVWKLAHVETDCTEVWPHLSKYSFNMLMLQTRFSPVCIALSFDGFGSISWHSIWVFSGSFTVFTICLDFQLFRPGYLWRDLISRNVHLKHHNWHRIRFTFTPSRCLNYIIHITKLAFNFIMTMISDL
jgi:hypothetical protein